MSQGRRRGLAELLRYALAGVGNTLVGLMLIAAGLAIGLTPLPANALGYAGGIAVSFVLNRGFVFRAGSAGTAGRGRQRVSAQARRYGLSVAGAYSLNLLALRSGLGHGLPVMTAQTLACLVYSGVLFMLCRGFVFRQPAPPGMTEGTAPLDGRPRDPG